MSSKDENVFLLKGNALFNNELIQFKSLEMNDQKSDLRRMNEYSNYSSASNYSTSRDEDSNFENLQTTVESTKEIQSNSSNLFAQDVLMKNFNSFLHHHQNQLISEDISSSLQINEKDTSFDEETVDYRVEHIRKLASGLFMMNGDTMVKSKSTLKKEIDYELFSDMKKYSGGSIDMKESDKIFELVDSKDEFAPKNDRKYQDLSNNSINNSKDKLESQSNKHEKNFLKSELIKSEMKSEKYESKPNFLDGDLSDLKAFEESLFQRYKNISISNSEKNKFYDSTGELNGNSSPSSLNSIKSSDLSTTLADYNYLTNNETSDRIPSDSAIDYLKLGSKIGNSNQVVDEIEQKLNESRTENLNLMIALENNNSTMKKNLEMAKSLKEELESTKSNFNQFKQQTNLVLENLMNKNKSLNQELVKAKQTQEKLEEENRKELEDQKIKISIELNELKSRLKEKEDQLKLTTCDLYQSDKKIKEQSQKLTESEERLEEYEKKINIYIKELSSQKSKLDLNNEEIEVRKRRILTLEENLGHKLNELENVQEELASSKKTIKQLEEKNDKLMQAVKQVNTYADKYKMEYEKRLSKEKDLSDFKQAIKRVIAERDETLKQLDVLKSNWRQYQQQAAEQQLQLQQQLTSNTPSLENKYHYQTSKLSKIYSSPALNDYYDTSNSIVPTSRSQIKHRLSDQNDLLALEKIEDDKSSLMNVLSKQNYLNNLISLNEQLNCDQCMLSNSYSQFNTLQMNGSNAKQHLADHCADLMNHIRQQKEFQQNEIAFLKNSKKMKKESQKITKLEKKSKSTFSLFNPALMLHGFKHKA